MSDGPVGIQCNVCGTVHTDLRFVYLSYTCKCGAILLDVQNSPGYEQRHGKQQQLPMVPRLPRFRSDDWPTPPLNQDLLDDITPFLRAFRAWVDRELDDRLSCP